jgi:NAD(P)-dependent dehydrogenase (short-subunit alcohol dehydrogenase family)
MINTMMAEKVYEGSEAYSGSKNTLPRMSQSVALGLGSLGIRVKSMQPRLMQGPKVEQIRISRATENSSSFDEECTKVSGDIALRYSPSTADHARTLLFLASDMSDVVTAQSLHVNVGMYIQ